MNDASDMHAPLLKRLLLRLRGESPSSAAIRESLEEVIEESERKVAALSQQERVMLTNLLAFGGLKVSDVMVPRARIIAADEAMPMAELVALFREAKHSRLPVYREILDDPTGLVHVKDVLALLEPDSKGGYRPIAVLDRPDPPADPVRAALDAGPGPAAQDAGHPHPSCPGDRRIWRHRRPGLDRGYYRGDRGRHRRRA